MAAGGATSPPEYIDLAVNLLYSALVSDKCARRNSWTLRPLIAGAPVDSIILGQPASNSGRSGPGIVTQSYASRSAPDYARPKACIQHLFRSASIWGYQGGARACRADS